MRMSTPLDEQIDGSHTSFNEIKDRLDEHIGESRASFKDICDQLDAYGCLSHLPSPWPFLSLWLLDLLSIVYGWFLWVVVLVFIDVCFCGCLENFHLDDISSFFFL